MTDRRGAASLLLSVVVLVSDPGPGVGVEGLEAQEETTTVAPRVLGARFEATIPEAVDGEAARTSIEVRYRVSPGGTLDSIPLTGIEFSGTRLRRLEAEIGGETVPVTLDRSRAPAIGGFVHLRSPSPSDDTLAVTLTYELDRAIPGSSRQFDLVLPLLLVDWTPAGAPDDMLRARVSIPASYSVQESFPTVPKEMQLSGDLRRYDFRLQVIPTMIRFRGHVGDPPVLSFSRLVDLGVLLLLIVAGALGWWGMQRSRS